MSYRELLLQTRRKLKLDEWSSCCLGEFETRFGILQLWWIKFCQLNWLAIQLRSENSTIVKTKILHVPQQTKNASPLCHNFYSFLSLTIPNDATAVSLKSRAKHEYYTVSCGRLMAVNIKHEKSRRERMMISRAEKQVFILCQKGLLLSMSMLIISVLLSWDEKKGRCFGYYCIFPFFLRRTHENNHEFSIWEMFASSSDLGM